MNRIEDQKRYAFLFLTMMFALIVSAQKSNTDFVTTWRTYNPGFSNDSSVTLNANLTNTSQYSFNYDVDWDNDGIFDTLNVTTASIANQYSDTGTYTIRIRGQFPTVRFNLFPHDAPKLISIDQWGNQIWKQLSFAFIFCDSMVYNAMDTPNLDSITSLENMFANNGRFNTPIDNWDVSNITNMTKLFVGAQNFNQPLNNWDVSSVTNMSRMFQGAFSFNQPLNNWDVSSVTNMSGMFQAAFSFDQPLDSWDVSSVTNMFSMFWNANLFNQPINTWNVSSVTDMTQMFLNASSFNQPLNSWNVSSVTTMFNLFAGANSFNQPLNNWDVSSVVDMSQMFALASSFNQNINSWDVSSVNSVGSMFLFATSFNQPLDNWNLSSVTEMSQMFRSASSFNQNVNSWDVSSVISMTNMFAGASSFDQPLTNWDISQLFDMIGIFDSSGISGFNYDSILISWQAKSHQSNVNVGAFGLNYCLGDSARNLLIADGWNFTGDTLNCTLVGIDELANEEQDFRVYPNPSSGVFTLSLDLWNGNAINFQLVNIGGVVLKESILTEQTTMIDFNDLPQGVYFLRVGSDVQKLIVSK